ncbi:hypothetical protein [Halpernia sp.]|uniref:hypothetical protein n=1 Tax=Halpernia sp. TaxID=2782209 RepID=UPI003A922CF6
MKNIFKIGFVGLILSLLFISCDNRIDDDYVEVIPTKMKIDSVQILSNTMSVNSVQSIRTYSTFSSNCTAFYGYDYVPNDFTRTVTAYSYSTSGNCGTPAAFANQFNFQPRQSGTYIFKFWTGKDGSGNDVFITKNIIVK